MDWQQVLDALLGWAKTAGVKIAVALVLWIVLFKLINAIGRRILKKAEKKGLDKTIARTLVYISKLLAKVTVVICLISYVGIDASGLTALVASFGVCVGLAVNGALSNLAGGIMIIVTRPFKLDDFIEACGHSGTVEEIRITQTKLCTPDNKVVFIPNGTLSSSEIINYSVKKTRRVDHTFSIGYQNDFEQAKAIVLAICEKHEKVLSDPAPFVRVCKHGESSVDIVTRVWTESADYWTVHFDLLEQVKAAFDEQGIEIPYGQLDVHIKQ